MPAVHAGFQVDHIVPPDRWHDYVAGRISGLPPRVGRRGYEHIDNFAWACQSCNVRKQQKLTHRILNGRESRLFDPRTDSWPDYFMFFNMYLHIIGRPGIGHATEQALRFNTAPHPDVLGRRHVAYLLGHYPPSWARDWRNPAELPPITPGNPTG